MIIKETPGKLWVRYMENELEGEMWSDYTKGFDRKSPSALRDEFGYEVYQAPILEGKIKVAKGKRAYIGTKQNYCVDENGKFYNLHPSSMAEMLYQLGEGNLSFEDGYIKGKFVFKKYGQKISLHPA